MIWIFIGGILLGFSYLLLIFLFLYHWQQAPEWTIPAGWAPAKTTVSVLIPARNEAANIAVCVTSILAQDYPRALFEIIVIDDHSTDNTASIVRAIHAPNLSLIALADYRIENHNSYKKAALEYGISRARGQLIVTTDADCIAEPHWLSHLVSYHEVKDKALLAAPVTFHQDDNFLEQFQALDYLGTMLMTGAGIHGHFLTMSNGANLAYRKDLFHAVNGFENINHLASGDDLLLVQKILTHQPSAMGFVKSSQATIKSIPQKNWKDFLRQRLRWAGKTNAYTDQNLIIIQTVVFLTCASIILLPISALWLGKKALILGGVILFIKSIGDFLLLRRAAHFFSRPKLMRIFFLAELLHTVYIFTIGLLALFIKKIQWKGRRVR